MVVKVYGKCNGSDVVFERVKGDIGNDVPDRSLWTCTVPKAVSGQYVLELFAVDGAGNESYFTKVAFYAYFNAGMLRTKWEILEIGSNWTIDDVAPVLGIDPNSYHG